MKAAAGQQPRCLVALQSDRTCINFPIAAGGAAFAGDRERLASCESCQNNFNERQNCLAAARHDNDSNQQAGRAQSGAQEERSSENQDQ